MASAYVDTSVLLRVVLKEPGQAVDMRAFSAVYASRMVKTEGLRTIGRLMLEKKISEAGYQQCRQRLLFLLQGVNLVQLSEAILAQAEGQFPVPLGTLDALHLVTALQLRDTLDQTQITLLTYDKQLERAALAMGLAVQGC